MPDILALLIEERDKFDRAIAALQGPKRLGRPPGSKTPKKAVAKKKRSRPPMSAAQREAVSKRMKALWAEEEEGEEAVVTVASSKVGISMRKSLPHR